MPTIALKDIPPATRQKLGLKKQREAQFTKEQVRSRALSILAEIADLTQDQRRRVLEHARKVNEV